MSYLFLILVLTSLDVSHGITKQDHIQLRGPRCTSRCLSNFAEKILYSRYLRNNRTGSSITADDVMKQCITSRNDESCKSCIQPCQRKFLSLPECMSMCSSDMECLLSCAFINDMSMDKMGYCSAPTNYDRAVKETYWVTNNSYTLSLGQARTSRSTCDDDCNTDYDCKSSQKCCNVDCAASCRRAVIRKSWVPWRPNKQSLAITEEITSNISYGLLSWIPQKKYQQKLCVIYLIQEKSVIARSIPKFGRFGWHTIHETTDTSVSLMHLKKGWWYKYRIAAVNVNGTRGFSKETKPFALPGRPNKPPGPKRLELSKIKIHSGAKYNILTQWKLADNVQSDLPLKGFYVTSRKVYESEDTKTEMKFIRFYKAVQLNGNVYWTSWIKGLRMFVPYEVSVLTVVSWEKEILTSPGSINITFQYPPTQPKQTVEDLQVQMPFVSANGSVTANISWNFLYSEAPKDVVRFMVHAYTTECYSGKRKNMEMWTYETELFFILHDLEYSCAYEVTVQAVYGTFRHQQSKIQKVRFSIPPCGMKDEKLIKSVNKEKYHQCGKVFPRSPSANFRISHWFKFLKDDQIIVELSWKLQQFVVYDALFLYLTDDKYNPIKWIYIPAQHTYCILQSLKENTLYHAYLIAVKNQQTKGVSAHTFKLPSLTSNTALRG